MLLNIHSLFFSDLVGSPGGVYHIFMGYIYHVYQRPAHAQHLAEEDPLKKETKKQGKNA